jgi:sugar phosphate isomerase/epimerase
MPRVAVGSRYRGRMTEVAQPVLALQLYTVREALRADPDAALARLADIGYRHVELFDLVAFGRPLAEALRRAGLRAVSAHQSVVGQDIEAICAAAADFEVGLVVDPWIDPDRWTTPDGIAAVAADLATAAEAAARHGVTIGYHNHWFELEQRLDDRTGLEVLARHLPPEVVLEVDTYWAAVGGEDPAALLGRLGSRVVALHLKDGPISRDTKAQVPVGQGAMRFPEIVAAAPRALRVVEADDSQLDRFELLARSRDYLVREGLA